MRVTEKDDQLVLRTSWSYLLTPFVMGLFVMLIAGGVFWTTAREAALACKRLEANQVQCQLQQILLGRVIKQVAVDNPQQAIVQSQHSSKGGPTYRLALVTARGTSPLTDFYSSDINADDLAEQFNQFQRNPAATTVLIDQPTSGWIFFLVLMFCGLGLIMILGAHYDTLVFDRYRAAVTYRHVRFTGRHTREEQLSGLKAEVRQFRGSKGRRYYCIFLHLENGTDLKFDWNAYRQAAAQDLADRIQEFVRPGVHIKYADA